MSNGTPEPDQTALELALIRWYALSIEKLATDLYITDRANLPAVKAALSAALQQLSTLRKSLKDDTSMASSCPPGYVRCEGICVPECDPWSY
jgi:hypothetical protein